MQYKHNFVAHSNAQVQSIDATADISNKNEPHNGIDIHHVALLVLIAIFEYVNV